MQALQYIYAQIARSPAAVAPGVQRGIFDYAVAQANDNILWALIARADAPEDLLHIYSDIDVASMRAVYLSRPDRTIEELEAATTAERRVTVLSTIAESEAASPALLTVLSRDTRRGVARAVLGNDNSPIEALTASLQHLVASYDNLPWSIRNEIRARVTARTELADVAVAATDSIDLLDHLALDAHLSRESQLRIVELCIEAAFAPGASRYSHETAARAALRLAANKALHPHVGARLLEVCANLNVASHTAGKLKSALGGIHASIGGGQVDTAVARQACAQTSRDPEALASICAQAVTEARAGSTTLAETLAVNPATPVGALIELMGVLTSKEVGAIVSRHPDNIDIVAGAMRAHVALVRNATLEGVEDPRAVLAAHVAAVTASAATLTSDVLAHMRAVMGCAAVDADIIASMPWPAVCHSSAPAVAAAAVAGILERALGDDSAAWHTFNVLASDYSGTLTDLVDTVTSL